MQGTLDPSHARHWRGSERACAAPRATQQPLAQPSLCPSPTGLLVAVGARPCPAWKSNVRFSGC
jgi:hypothetical protein